LPEFELADIGASLQAAVYRAYNLGRSDALRQVADRLKALEPSAEARARIAQTETPPSRELKSMGPEGSSVFDQDAMVGAPSLTPLAEVYSRSVTHA